MSVPARIFFRLRKFIYEEVDLARGSFWVVCEPWGVVGFADVSSVLIARGSWRILRESACACAGVSMTWGEGEWSGNEVVTGIGNRRRWMSGRYLGKK